MSEVGEQQGARIKEQVGHCNISQFYAKYGEKPL